MSDTIQRYRLEILSAHVPADLMGTPLPVEIVSAAGHSKKALLTLGDHKATIVVVEKPGRYSVRAELPSGLWIMEQGDIAKSAATIVLDFGSEHVVVAGSPTRGIPNLLGRRLGASAPTYSSRSLIRPPIAHESSAAPINLHCGEFVKWNDAAKSDSITNDSLIIHHRISTQIQPSLPATVSLKPDPPWSWDSPRNWRPCLVVTEIPHPSETGSRILAMWPWRADEQAMLLLPDTPPATDPDRAPVLAMCDSGNRTVDSLFSYIRGGALDSARQAAPSLISLAESFLREKEENPVLACVAAYTLFKIGSPLRQDWVANLANRFPFISDGAVVHAWNLLHAGKTEDARHYFHQALERGLPMYTIGIRLLRDGLNFVRGLYPNDAQVQIDATRASRLASFANLDSELSCIRLDKGFGIDFEKGASASPW